MEAVKEIFKSGAVISMTVLLVVLVAFVFVAVGPSFIVIEEDTIQELVITDTNTGVTTVVDPLAEEDYELVDPESGEVEALDDSNIIEFLFIDPETEKPVITPFQVEELTFAHPKSEGPTAVSADCVNTSGDSSQSYLAIAVGCVPDSVLEEVDDEGDKIYSVHNSWTSSMWKVTWAGLIIIGGFSVLWGLALLAPRLKSIGNFGNSPSPERS